MNSGKISELCWAACRVCPWAQGGILFFQCLGKRNLTVVDTHRFQVSLSSQNSTLIPRVVAIYEMWQAQNGCLFPANAFQDVNQNSLVKCSCSAKYLSSQCAFCGSDQEHWRKWCDFYDWLFCILDWKLVEYFSFSTPTISLEYLLKFWKELLSKLSSILFQT